MSIKVLGIFYIVLALILVGTNMGRNKRKIAKKPGVKRNMKQVMEGKGVKSEVVGDYDNGLYSEEEV